MVEDWVWLTQDNFLWLILIGAIKDVVPWKEDIFLTISDTIRF
jgi:hypothetical protein